VSGLASPLSENEIWSTVQERILNCTFCRKRTCTHFRTCQILSPPCVKTHHSFRTLGNTARKLLWVQTAVVGILEQMKRPQTKWVDEHYTEGKPKLTEVSKHSCWIQIIWQQHSLFWHNTVMQNNNTVPWHHTTLIFCGKELCPGRYWSHSSKTRIQDKIVPVYSMKTYRGSTVTTALICNLSRKQSWVIRLMHEMFYC